MTSDGDDATSPSPAVGEDEVARELRLALRTASVGTWHWDAASDTVRWNDELAAVFGVTPAQFPGPRAATARYVHPEDRAYASARTAEAIERRGSARFEYRIVRPDGAVRWVETRASVHTADDGRLTGASGVTFDITDRKTAEAERDQLQARLALLAEVTTTLASSLNVGHVLDQLASLVVPRLCDAVLIDCLNDEGLPKGAVVRAADPDVARLLERAESLSPRRHNPKTAAGRAFTSGAPALVPDVTEDYVRSRVTPSAAADCYLQAQITSAVVAPLLARGGVVGIMSMYAARSSRRYGDADADLAIEIGRRAGLALDNARLYAVERRVAETLQRALLPTLPHVPGLDLAARYLPSGGPAQEVGGDWYDVFPTVHGAIGFTVGDVGGHDLHAAAAMAHTRSALRAHARHGQHPADVLRLLAGYVEDFAVADLITVGYGLLHPCREPRQWSLNWASCGHPPPLLVTADGQTRYLDVDAAPPLGVPPVAQQDEAHATLAPGDTLICYTDGLIETRHTDLTAGLDLLADAAARHLDGTADVVCDAILTELAGRLGDDDVALLAIRVTA